MIARVLIYFVRMYQNTISPMIGASCRFSPTCSEYAVLAIERHGVVKGLWKAVWRIARCHPFSSGGVDLP